MKWEVGTNMILDHVTEEMREWLEENCKGRYSVRPNTVRFKYAGPSVPLSECERQEGWEIWFDGEEMAVAFKLMWL